MPDIGSSPAIDVALGLVFVFFLLSVICSTVNELIAAAMSWRAKFLEEGLRSMLVGTQDKVGDSTREAEDLLTAMARHPLISGKVSGLSKVRFPSYLHGKTFALTFLDTVAPPEPGGADDVLARADKFARSLGDGDPVRRALIAFIDQAQGNGPRFRRSVETWFDNTMDRVSGWYKRRTQIALIAIALVVTVAINADALQIGRSLWNDATVRATVVAQAQKAVAANQATSDVGNAANGGSNATLSEQVAEVKELQLPLGWSTDRKDPRWFDSFWGFLGKVLGLLATTIALTLGAPFWFDLLGRVSRVRTTGKPEREGAA